MTNGGDGGAALWGDGVGRGNSSFVTRELWILVQCGYSKLYVGS